jgi:Ca2+-binding RTX toxin-like protein
LRNNLLGLPLDLPAINIARGRDTGVPTLNQARAEFYAWTGDSQLKPYASWAELGGFLKHEASLVNFVAAYGKHATITAATTLADRRAAAYALVYGEDGMDGVAGSGDEPTTEVPADRATFMNGPAADTGVNDIDLWIGGMAEKIMPFGGMLGSTFNYVFENQMEKLQNGDRFYYLERTAGLNFLTELENNTFAKIIMANTDATHLPGDVFSTPAFTLEVTQALQHTGLDEAGADGLQGTTDDVIGADGIAGNSDPLGEVFRNDPATAGTDTNYLRYTGAEHVVLGGSAGRDTLIASEGDDAIYGDGNNDRLEGGFGNDMVFGGAGDDIMTDAGGDDNMQGGEGNDAIHGGNGLDLLLGGFGNDFIVTGEDSSESFGGGGNDFILGTSANEVVFGGEGDDWIEHGMADGSAGENFDTRGLDSITGNDVFMGDTVSDRMGGEGGDDIMVGNGGQIDRYDGASGFDWAVFKHPTEGAFADLNLSVFNEAPVPLSRASTLDRFASVEGVSGSAFADILIGDDANATTIAASGARGSVLTNFDLIDGLREFVELGGPAVTSFSSGNIILGGAGSDLIEGRGGDDLIDGDLALNVSIGVRNASGVVDRKVDSMSELVEDVFAGRINPGQLVIVREIVQETIAGRSNFDTAVFTGSISEYSFDINEATGVTTVTHNLIDAGVVVGIGADGVDRLTNIERLQFNDFSMVLVPGLNFEPEGFLLLNDPAPTLNQVLSAPIAAITDGDNVSLSNPTGAVTGPVTYTWQIERVPGSGFFEDMVAPTGVGDVRAAGPTFRTTEAELGLSLRVKAIYQDANGVLETVYSAPGAPVSLDEAAGGTLAVSDPTPTETQTLTADNLITDDNGLANAVFNYQWQQSAVGGGGAFTNIAGANGATFTPGQAHVNRALRVTATFTDDLGNPGSITSAATIVTGDFIAGNNAAQALTGNAGQDIIDGGFGNDTLNGLGENDDLTGGVGNDIVNGGAGDDTLRYVFGHGIDTMDGGTGQDTLIVTGSGTVNTLFVTYAGGALTRVANGTVTGIESVTADLLGDIDVLNYNGTTAAVNVDLGAGTASGFTSIAGIENVVGGSGSDMLAGAAGVTNQLTGGSGNDTFVVHDTSDAVIEVAGGGTEEVRSLAANYTISDIDVENLSFIGAGNFTGTGNAANNVITGGGGNDSLSGLGGNDNLQGGMGDDTLAGGDGNDLLNVQMGQGTDNVDGGIGTDTLSLTGTGLNNMLGVVFNGTALTSLTGLTVSNVESFAANLLGGTDTLNYGATTSSVIVNLGTGSASGFTSIAGIENVTGGGGADLLVGTAGTINILVGAGGNDTFVVHDTGDVVNEVAGGGTDSVLSFANSFTLANENVENLTFTGAGNFTGNGNLANNTITGGGGNDSLNGGAGNDTVQGGGGSDTLVGAAGNDRLTGGAGNDTMDGGLNNDVFVFQSGFGIDRISGFDANATSGQDLMELSGLGITAGNFAASVGISVSDLNADGTLDTLVSIAGAGSIELLGVNGVGANSISQTDFIFS